MDIKEEKICRICLNEVFKGSEVLDETARHMFDVLLLKMNWDISKEPIMCQECAENAKTCFSFKSACVNTENITRSFTVGTLKGKVDLGDVYENAHTGICEDSITCRFCMNQLGTTSFVSLNMSTKEMEMLPMLMPEMDSNLTEKPLICIPCRESLERYVKFAQNCADVEGRIRKYCQDERIDDTSQIKLSSIVLRDVLNSTPAPAIKKETDTFEEPVIKVEEPLDIKDEFSCLETVSKTPSDQFEAHPIGCDNSLTFSSDGDSLEVENMQKHSVRTNNTKLVSETKMYQCSVCSYKAKYKSYITRHAQIHNDAPETEIYKCSVCTYKTKIKGYLTKHLLIHKDATKMYKCSVCSYESKYKRYITRHSLIHKDASETKMYKCSGCTYETKHKKYLASHLLIHKDASETEIYKCSHCTYETKHKRNLISHLVIHKDASETNMYKCSVCTYETKRKKYLTRHLLSHKGTSQTEIYRCSHCTYETKYRRNLITHLLIHKDASEIKMYKCSVCAFETKYKSYLPIHSLVHKSA